VETENLAQPKQQNSSQLKMIGIAGTLFKSLLAWTLFKSLGMQAYGWPVKV
jgi:hypothetical protein